MPEAFWEELERTGRAPLRDLRRWRNLTQDQLAEAVGVQQSYISALESHERQGAPDTLKAIARVLRVAARSPGRMRRLPSASRAVRR